MSVAEFTEEMRMIGLGDEEISYLIEIDSLRCAAGMYANLGTLAGLIRSLCTPISSTIEDIAAAIVDKAQQAD